MPEQHTEVMQEVDLRRAEDQSLHRDQPPTTVPGYKIERLLGKGAFGEVWLGENRNTGSKMAIKFYARRGGVDWSLLAREVEKLRALAADRCITQLHEVGWQADPPYYVMEYLEHGSLEDRLQQGPLPATQAVELFREVAVGLAHAHAKGILHCDLKPANILLDQDFKPRLADFGQARLTNDQTPALGTLFYMAPEQADTKATPDARWDVYALGVLLYRMLTGQLPGHEETQATEIQSSVHLQERLARYSQYIRTAPRPTAHRRVPGVDRRLAELVDSCLAPDPEKRLPSVGAVLAALDRRALKRARRPLLVLGGVIPALLLILILIITRLGMHQAITTSAKALLENEWENDQWDAHHTTQLLAYQIDSYWRNLERAAHDPSVRTLLTAVSTELDKLQRPIQDWRKQSPQAAELQSWLEQEEQATGEQKRRSWSLFSRQGIFLAASPLGAPNSARARRIQQTLGTNLSHRTFFTGRDEDLPENQHAAPLRDVHISRPFKSKLDEKWIIAFSAPVFAPNSKDEVAGVILVSVELRELELGRGSDGEEIVIFDSKGGTIVAHPGPDKLDHQASATLMPKPMQELAARWAEIKMHSFNKNDAESPKVVLPADELIQELNHSPGSWRTDQGLRVRDYQDPISVESGARDHWQPIYHGQKLAGCDVTARAGEPPQWLAVVDAVIVKHDGKPRDPHLGIVVQERLDQLLTPIEELRGRLHWQSWMAFALVVVVGGLTWGYIYLLLNDSSRSRLAAFVRKRAGLSLAVLSGRSTASRTGGAALTRTNGQSLPLAEARTLPGENGK
jgi:serine/threonine protein kinase